MRALTRAELALWPRTAAALLVVNGKRCVTNVGSGLDSDISDTEAAGCQGTRSAGTVKIYTAREAKSQY